MDDFAPTEEFYTSLGRFTVNWSRLELALDLLMLRAHEKFSGPQKWMHVTQISEKLAIAEKEILPQVERQKADRLLDIIQTANHITGTRHQIIHGVAYGFSEVGDQVMSFGTLIQSRKKPRRPILRTRISEIGRLADLTWDLEGQLLDELVEF
jgi:hypothetical protein